MDFFCGLGNFSLPLARSGAEVLGLEGVDEMVARANANAAAQGLADRCQFRRADLFAVTPKQPPKIPTSSPARNTLGSLRISMRMPSLIASLQLI